MALTRKIIRQDEPETDSQAKEQEPSSQELTMQQMVTEKKVEDTQKTISEKVVPKDIHTTQSHKDIVDWLLTFFDKSIWENLRSIMQYRLPYQDAENPPALEEWLTALLKANLRHNEQVSDVEMVAKAIQEHWLKPKEQIEKLAQGKTALEETIQKNIEKQNTLSKERDEAQVRAFRAEETLKSYLPIHDFVNMVFEDKEGQRFMPLWEDALKNPHENLTDFTTAYSKAWAAFKKDIASLPSDEDERMEALHKFLSNFLKRISKKYITQRRQMLDTLANIASVYLTTYDFVSPEESRQIDPDIHTPVGNGELVVEGISFAVLKRSNKQVMRYAEVRT